MTVRSCAAHNNEKSDDDIYVLAQICLNASPRNRSREVFMERVAPQLGFNDEALRKMISKDAELLPGGAVAYNVDIRRMNRFFTALSCGILFKGSGRALPLDYGVQHVYHNLIDHAESSEMKTMKEMLLRFYSGEPTRVLNFGQVPALNAIIYSVKIFGVSEFRSSITIVHEFFGAFRVTSMLTRLAPDTLVESA